MTTTIDKFGRILIPKSVRKELGLEPGNSIDLIVIRKENSLFLRPTFLETVVLKTDDFGIPILSYATDTPITLDLVKEIKDGREERDQKIFGR